MKKNPAKRLQPVIEQSTQQERQAAAKLAQSQQQLAQQQASLSALQRYQGDYQKQWLYLAKQSQSAQTLQDYRRFLEHLQSAIDAQQRRTLQSQQHVEQAQNHWQQQQSRTAALRKLQTRYQHQQQQLENKREQRLLDDLAQSGQVFSTAAINVSRGQA